jgi:hypothetical protein
MLLKDFVPALLEKKNKTKEKKNTSQREMQREGERYLEREVRT